MRQLLLALGIATSVASAQTQRLGPADDFKGPATDTARVGVGAVAPDFSLVGRDGRVATLSSYRGAKRIILVFYRGHW
jgi:cytochrome oxidase Cu insertion factor (SCO1/SenC/PrrC family)